jgi:uncharacterized FlaG/YvyC family protein
MDVPVAATAAPNPTLSTAAPQPAPAPTPVSAAATAPSSAPAPQAPADKTVAPVVAKLFNTAEDNVSVSFQIQPGSSEVVTVFTDKSTGKEIIQFPSQEMIAFGELLDKDAGKVLDKSV